MSGFVLETPPCGEIRIGREKEGNEQWGRQDGWAWEKGELVRLPFKLLI